MNIEDRIRKYELEAMEKVFHGTNPDGDVDRMYIPREYTKQLYETIVKDMMAHLAAHALSNSTALDVFAQWTEMYEGKVIDRGIEAPRVRFDDFDF